MSGVRDRGITAKELEEENDGRRPGEIGGKGVWLRAEVMCIILLSFLRRITASC